MGKKLNPFSLPKEIKTLLSGKCIWLLSSDPAIKNIKTNIYEFPLKKIKDVANGLSHKRAKYQLQIVCILSYIKINKNLINLEI